MDGAGTQDADAEDAAPRLRFRANPFALIGLVAIGAFPLAVGWLFSRERTVFLDDFGAFLLAPACWAIGYAYWLGTHVFEVTPEALIRTRMGETRRVTWDDIRSVRQRSFILVGARGATVEMSTGLLQATRWQVLGRRGWVLMQLPSVMWRARILRLAIEHHAGEERAKRLAAAGEPNEEHEIDAVTAGRRRRWRGADADDGIALPLEVVIVFAPAFLLGGLVLMLSGPH